MENNKTLHLVLTLNWFVMIYSRRKREEYRKLTPFWCNVFLKMNGKRKSRKYWQNYFLFTKNGMINQSIRKLKRDLQSGFITFIETDSIIFSHGYKTDRDQFKIDCLKIGIEQGLNHWGAEKDKMYFTLKLGKVSAIIINKTIHKI